jgi:tryptophan halogenase
MALFKRTGRVFKPQEDVFSENSWVQVMMGQGLMPQGYHNIADAMADTQLDTFLTNIRVGIDQSLGRLPDHQGFLNHLSETR